MSIEHESSRIFSAVYIIISVLTVAYAMGNLSECIMDMRAEKRSASLLGKSLNTGALEQMDEDGDGVSDVSISFRAVCHRREDLSSL